MMKSNLRILSVRFPVTLVVMASFLYGCSDEVGSKAWCESMQKQPQSAWTMEDAKNYAKHCLGQR